MEQPPDPNRRSGTMDTQIVVALIGAAATLLAALLAGYFALNNRDQPTPESPVTSADPVVSINGPTTAPINQVTYFTIISSNANRAEWSVGGFDRDDPNEVSPLPPAYEIWIEPTDESRVGDTFVLAVTVYSEDGRTASATHTFLVTDDE